MDSAVSELNSEWTFRSGNPRVEISTCSADKMSNLVEMTNSLLGLVNAMFSRSTVHISVLCIVTQECSFDEAIKCSISDVLGYTHKNQSSYHFFMSLLASHFLA